MNRPDRPPAPELDPLFAAAKTIDPVAGAARTRALIRAHRTAAAANDALAPLAAPTGAWVPRRRLALAAGALLVLGATGAVAAFLRARPDVPAAEVDEVLAPAAHEAPVAARPQPPPVAAAPPDVGPPRRPRPPHGHASPQAELGLIQRAQTSYADGNLHVALDLLAEHARRFPNGRLAEEREALRIRSLARCGRSAEARRALLAFADRFPDSVLLPHLQDALAGSDTRP